MFVTIVFLAIGLVLLVVGADSLVKGASAIASRFGISPVIIGLTVVAFGTSTPEMAVSVSAAITGNTDVAFGNVVGSNIGNILLILGLSAVAGALVVSQRLIKLDVPILLVVCVVVLVMALDGSIGRIDGALLFAGIIVYTGWLVRAARRERTDITAEYTASVENLERGVIERSLAVQILLVVAGLGLLILGGQLLVNSATEIAESIGVSDLVIGLTVVAIGTSLPELATSVLASLRGERDIAVGNVVGSNLFNLMAVLGLSGVVADKGIDVAGGALTLDIPVMIASTLVLLPIFLNGFEIRRWEGFVLMAFYAVYVVYLVLDTSDHGAADEVGAAAAIITPLVLFVFVIAAMSSIRERRRTAATTAD